MGGAAPLCLTADSAYRRACAEWKVLTAGALNGLARRALEIGAAYASERMAFGKPIGTFQGVAHPLADVATALAGSELLARKAAWRLDGEADRRSETLAAMAMAFAAETSHPAHRRLRAPARRLWSRAGIRHSIVSSAGQGLGERRRTALGRIRRHRPSPLGGRGRAALRRGEMDFSITDDEGKFQDEVRGFMDRYVTEAVLDRCHRTGTMHDWTLHRALGAQGWLGLSWPAEVGGQARSPMEAALFYEEANRGLAPLYGLNTTMVAARAVLACGADHLRAEVIPRVLRGEIIICLGFSEPDSGSDVAAARTRARRDGDVWIVNGQKVFTSVAEEAEYVLLLVRTDPAVPKHQGLTVLLVPMSSEGIEITPIMTLGERTNMTYYRDVVCS